MYRKMIDQNLFIPEIYNPETRQFNAIKEQIEKVDRLSFPRTFPKRLGIHTEWFTNPRNTIAILNHNGLIIGFSIARPVIDIWPEKTSEMDSCNVSLTAVVPEFQKKGFAKLILLSLRQALKSKGYKYWERNLEVENGWAKSFIKFEGDKIVAMGKPRETEFGIKQYVKSEL